MRSFTQLAFTIALGVLTSTAALAETTAPLELDAAKTVVIALDYESSGLHSGHQASALTGKPVTVVFENKDQQIKIHYVIDYNSDGLGQIISEIQSAPLHSDAWTPLANYSAQFEDDKDFTISGNQTDGKLFSIKHHIAQKTAL